MSGILTVLILGDVVGQPGCRALYIGLRGLVQRLHADFVIVNAENAADGFGLTPAVAHQLLDAGIDVLTSGNHIWQKREIYDLLQNEKNLLRPDNYPKGAPGSGVFIADCRGSAIAVVNLQGRVRMYDVDCPFEAGLSIARKLKSKTPNIIVDFHAEDPAEKEALGMFLDGSVSAIVGTHTHVQTADERLLPRGTAFISDLGMTGPSDSVIGVDPTLAIRRSMTQMPLKMDVVDHAAVISGVVLSLNSDTGKVSKIERVRELSSV